MKLHATIRLNSWHGPSRNSTEVVSHLNAIALHEQRNLNIMVIRNATKVCGDCCPRAAGNFLTGVKLLPSCISDSGRRTCIGVRQISLQHKYGYFSHSMAIDEAPVSDVNRAKNEGVTVVCMRLQP